MNKGTSYGIIIFSKDIPLNQDWINKWDVFVESFPCGNIFQSSQMFRVYIQNKKYSPFVFLYIDEGNNIRGVLLAVIVKEYEGILGFLSSRTLIIGGPLIPENDLGMLDSLLSKLNKTLEKKSILTQFRNFKIQEIYFQKEFLKHKFRFSDHLNIVLDLRAGVDVIWDNLSRSRKKGIKKAMNEDFVFEYSKDISIIPEFYDLLSSSYKRIKLPYPGIEHFYNLTNNFNQDNYALFSLKHKGINIAILFSLIYKNTLYGYYVGVIDNAAIRKLKPMDFFFWELIKWAITNKIDFYDWMGAGKPNKQYGVRDFKLQFGGELLNFGRYERVNYPIVYFISRVGLFFRGLLKSIS
jgi:lipid II:glycine glycyltransferase (peptidoglycan interpeptide bridge formation enzyme)